MQNFKYLIIGGGIAGTTAAETIRRNDSAGSIAIVSDEPYPLYSKIMLSKPAYFLGKLKEGQVFMKSPEWYEQQKINLMLGKKAVKLDSGNKIVVLNDGEELRYEKLLLAVGGCPRLWPVKGAEKEGVLYLRTLDDYKKIKKTLEGKKHIVIIGSGFISFEMCDILRLAGYEVTVVMVEPHYAGFLLDEISGKIIEEALEKGGVKIKRNAEVQEVLGKDRVEGVILKDGTKIDCDAIICGIGIACPVDWLALSSVEGLKETKEAGVEIGRGIITNEYLETNVPDIWAAGDAAEFNDVILEERIQMGNWLNAQMQGKIAGLNMTGKKEVFRLVSSYSSEGFGITIVYIGDIKPGPDKKIIPRGSFEEKSYCRFIIKDDEIIGATLINRTVELPAIKKLIEKDVKVGGFEDKLADSNFDLETLIPHP